MLKGIDPVLSPDLLKRLAEMGHDDTVVLADANFTAMSLAAGKPVLRLPGVDMVRAMRAVASVLPLAQDVACPVAFMQVCDAEAGYRSAVQREALAVLTADGLRDDQIEAVERYAFYERVRKAYAIVVTGELQPWSNFILHKGVLSAALRA
ncbi:RbsD/FucU family protein [Hydrogenophaga sp.]|uniref:RbsD/FucU family protein n=1 Tax=Hydrogenophaga sp. TaxID=1904254 RepID=UPI0035623C07